MKLVVILTMLLHPVFLHSQTKFQRTYGSGLRESTMSGIYSYDGGYVISFTTDSYPAVPALFTSSQSIIMKLDSLGERVWTKSITKSGFTSHSGPLIQTLDSGYLMRMEFFKNGIMDHPCYIKTDMSGNKIWMKCGLAARALQHSDTSYTIGGLGYTKLDKNGIPLSSKGYFGANGASDFNLTNDNGYIFATSTSQYAQGGVGDQDIYMLRADSAGKILWSKSYGISGISGMEQIAGGIDAGRTVIQTKDGGFILAGITNSWGPGSVDVLLIKTDSTGALQWTKTYGGSNSDIPVVIRETFEVPGYVVIGQTPGGAETINPQKSQRSFIMKIDTVGNIEWNKMYGSVGPNQYNAQDIPMSGGVISGLNAGYFIAGYSHSMGVGDRDVWLVKTDLNGVSGCNEIPLLFNVSIPPLTIVSNGGDTMLAPPPFPDSTLKLKTWTPIDSIYCPATSVGLSELQATQDQVLIYPNPGDGIFNINVEGRHEIKGIEVFDVLGKMIYEELTTKIKEYLINLTSIPEGIYLLKIYLEDSDKILCSKVVVTK